MRWVIVNTDYPDFLRHHYSSNPGLERAPYQEQLQARRDTLFGVADFYSANLRKLGQEAWELYANNDALQRAWARERGIGAAPAAAGRSLRPQPPAVHRLLQVTALKRLARSVLERRTLFAPPRGRILAAQLAHYRPDVVLNQATEEVDAALLRTAAPNALIVGQIASPLPDDVDFRSYDLVVSSLPHFVDRFRAQGVPSELNRLAFDPRVLSRIGPRVPGIDVSFVGSLSPAHAGRLAWIEPLCYELPVAVWAHGAGSLPPGSPIRRRLQGQAWGADMYAVLRRSKITLNHHIDVAEDHANNMRLFEATGAGALLVTDSKRDLAELFEPGCEVAAYRTPQECIALVRRYLEDDGEREAVARAGQARTLRDHTYLARMRELAEICAPRLARKRRDPGGPTAGSRGTGGLELD